MRKAQLYLDYAASTPVRDEVLQAMQPYWATLYGNASSVHRHGQLARDGLTRARTTVASCLGCHPDEVYFTGCGSESDNLAIRGIMWAARQSAGGNHLITSAIEHKAVLDTAKQLRDIHGFELSILPVDRYGVVDLDRLENEIRNDTVLISIMAANNEIGTQQPVEAIGAITKRMGVFFHTDAIQAANAFVWNLANADIDLMSLSAHKFYGPKGLGILYVRRGTNLVPVITGGGQEEGLRAGTSNLPLIVGAAEALRLAVVEREEVTNHQAGLRDFLIDQVMTLFGQSCRLTGHPSKRLPHIASFAFHGLNGNDLLLYLDQAGVCVSSGSACLTGSPEPSSVLTAIGLGEEWNSGGLRVSIGRATTLVEIETFIAVLQDVIEKIRSFNKQLA